MSRPQLYGHRVATYAASSLVALAWVIFAALAWGQCSDIHDGEPATVATSRTTAPLPTLILVPAVFTLPTAEATPAGEQGVGSSASLLAPRPAAVGSAADVEAATAAPVAAAASAPVSEPRPVPTDSDALAFALALESSPWPEHLWDDLTGIAWCESRFDPAAVGDRGRSLGALQVHVPAWPQLAQAYDLLDLGDNLSAAWEVYVAAGHSFQPWSCRP